MKLLLGTGCGRDRVPDGQRGDKLHGGLHGSHHVPELLSRSAPPALPARPRPHRCNATTLTPATALVTVQKGWAVKIQSQSVLAPRTVDVARRWIHSHSE